MLHISFLCLITLVSSSNITLNRSSKSDIISLILILRKYVQYLIIENGGQYWSLKHFMYFIWVYFSLSSYLIGFCRRLSALRKKINLPLFVCWICPKVDLCRDTCWLSNFRKAIWSATLGICHEYTVLVFCLPVLNILKVCWKGLNVSH